MRYYCISVLICTLALWPLSALAQGAPTVDVETYGLRISERTIEVLFKVTERGSGRDLQGLRPADLVVLENGTPVNSSVELREEASDANGERTIDLGADAVSGSQALNVSAVGATIGIVYDASTLLNAAGDPVNYLENGRMAIEAFLEAGRATAPRNPESIGLFIPLSVPAISGETLRPAELPEFVQDRNAVINTLRVQQPRSGRTNIFDTLAVALRATAEAAAARGTNAYVVLVTDGGDSASVGSYDALVNDAAALGVTLIIFGVGPEQRLANNAAALTTLASKTGGVYVGNPNPGAVQEVYRNHVEVTGQSAYVLRYTTDLLDDGKDHQLVIQVRGVGNGQSLPLPIRIRIGDPDPVELSGALQNYLIRAVPIVVLCSLILSLALVAFQRFSTFSGSISSGMTRR
jgi:hypothetical protein